MQSRPSAGGPFPRRVTEPSPPATRLFAGPWPPTPHPGGSRFPGGTWLKTEAHQFEDFRRREPGTSWLALFGFSHFWGAVFLPRPSRSLPTHTRQAQGRRRCHGWRKRLGVWPGNPPPGCSSWSVWSKPAFPNKDQDPRNSLRHPEMALMTSYTRTSSNNFLQDLCMPPSHKTSKEHLTFSQGPLLKCFLLRQQIKHSMRTKLFRASLLRV